MLKGRINRATFWAGVALYVGFCLALSLLAGINTRGSDVVLAIVAVLRLHDLGRTGWIVLGPILLQLAAGVGAALWLPQDDVPLALGAVVVVMGALLAWLGAVRGQPGPNRFGDPPAPGVGYRPPGR